MQSDDKSKVSAVAPGDLVSASWLAGVPVVDTQGEAVGEFAHVMLDVASGTIAFGVLSSESLFGSTERLVAVPWRSLAFDSAGRFFVLHEDRERLRHAPQRERAAWPLLADAQFTAEMLAYFGAPPGRD